MVFKIEGNYQAELLILSVLLSLNFISHVTDKYTIEKMMCGYTLKLPNFLLKAD